MIVQLFLYSKLKTDIKLEDYLKLTKKINNRQLLTKFRTSDHPLEIELGRYKKIPRHQRLCKTWKVLDDEIHFFLQCQINNNLRNVLINNIKNYNMTSIKRHTRYYSITLYLAQVQCTTNMAVPCDSRCEITVTTECKQTKHRHITYV